MTLPATDSFTTGSDQALTTYSGNWTLNNGNFQVIASTDNVHSNAAGTETGAHWNADSFNDDQYSQVVLAVLTTASSHIGACVRAAAAAATFYGFYSNEAASYLYKIVTGTWTQLGSTQASLGSSSTLKITASGTTITPYDDDVVTGIGAQTDSSISSGSAGIVGYSNSTVSRLDDWEGGNLGVATLTASVSDTVTVNESISISLPNALVVSKSESITIGESVSVSVVSADTLTANVTDTIAISESIDISFGMLISTSDTVTVGESISISMPDALVTSVSDTVTVGEDITVIINLVSLNIIVTAETTRVQGVRVYA